MKIVFLLFLSYLLTGITTAVQARQIPGGNGLPAATPVLLPLPYTGTQVNSIRKREPSIPTADTLVVLNATDIKAVRESTQYFDGLGRLLQQVQKGASPAGKDIVTPVVYDDQGREAYTYLPYTAADNNGKFKAAPFTGQQAFLRQQYPGEQIYYQETQYEPSHLSRVTKTLPPGNSWGGSGKGVTQQYLVNTVADGVRIWDIAPGALPTSNTGRTYAAGALLKEITTDENGNRTVVFKDAEDRILLRKTATAANAADGHPGWLCTYYVYDDLYNLRAVIPPKAVDAIRSNWVVTPAVAAGLCYLYGYDGKRRTIFKKIRGEDTTEIVYDVRDRPAFTRDGNLRHQQQWLVTFYDALNRPISTALYKSAATRATLQNSLNTATSNSQAISYTFPGVTDLSVNHFDGRAQYKATESVTLEMGFDTGGGTDTDVFIDTTLTSGTTTVTATHSLPGINMAALIPLTYHYYDHYNYTGALPSQPVDTSRLQTGGYPYPDYASAPVSAPKGFPTGTKVRIPGTDTWLTTTSYYNRKGRLVQSISENANSGQDITTTLYSFDGKVLSTYNRHSNPRSRVTPDIKWLNILSYDAAGRLQKVARHPNDSALKTIAQYTYHETGQLKTTTLGNNLESLTYTYNIRGWLKGINTDYARSGGNHFFGTELHYDHGYTQQQYNGNIAGITWRSKGDPQWRSYGYTYDGANRLLKGNFTQFNGGWNTSAGINFSMQMGNGADPTTAYDANGNILAMTHQGLKGAVSTTIDNLTYTYPANSNQLQGVADAANDPSSQLGDFKETNGTGNNDYSYDDNGNLTRDANKNIPANGITYNHLNLPTSVTVTGKGTIQFVYDAVGNKLRKTVTDLSTSPATTTVTDYIKGIVYCNDTLQYLPHEEGRIRLVLRDKQPISYVYDYFLKDHLGNIRSVLTEQTDFSIYKATMETDKAALENTLFSNIDNTRVPRPAGYPTDSSSNKSVARLSPGNNGKKTGPSLVLKVMAGDTLQIAAKAFYKTDQAPAATSTPAATMLADLIQTFSGNATADGDHGAGTTDNFTPFNISFFNNDYQRLKEKDPEQRHQENPKAYLNYILFDDQFKLVDQSSGVKQVKKLPDQLQILQSDKIVVNKSGFMYVYTSNESPYHLFFDDVVVTKTDGPLLEETHYYPFGLTMAGISSNALKGTRYVENRKKYNGIEYTNELDLDTYDAQFRNLDPQTGRWNQIDPKIEKMELWSPYVSNYDNPIRYNDFLGDEPGPGDPIKQVGIVTGREYNLTIPTDVGSALKFAVQYVGGILNEGIEATNRYVNPLVPAAELAVGKSYESGFSEGKSRVISGVEMAASLIPGGKTEIGAAKIAERSVVSLDNNAIVAAIKEGKKDAVKIAIGSDRPIISTTAAKEWLSFGSKGELKGFMKEIGATISKNGGSASQAAGLQQKAASLGRALGNNDAMILSGAMNNKAAVLTVDKKFTNFMKAIGYPTRGF
ncbi:DUF6443 domain-containing protein [Chitinophaga nivalis]|uniref:DUF6443 domain-containing protein n=1 Tax=Chitinophaga nivalis TaxID=2991709 RepID=A0ABT3IKJ9_9BACT|nr:DUF6443 domain-containing protein [Chitinophaga nivalis]MCW3465823.1 DUF6443 domain-containing protein [Chitinophaga nivalis]MCW3484486.1 DUF6443 domain-containing protein [Chitinophaga nivalis]